MDLVFWIVPAINRNRGYGGTLTGVTRLELAPFRSTGDCSDRLSYTPAKIKNTLSLSHSSWDCWRLIPRTTTRSGYCGRSLYRQCPQLCDMINYLFSFQSSYCFWDKAFKLFALRHTFILHYVIQNCQGGNTTFFKIWFFKWGVDRSNQDFPFPQPVTNKHIRLPNWWRRPW